MLCKVKTVKTETSCIQRDEIKITKRHINNLNRDIRKAVSENNEKYLKGIDNIGEKIYH